MGRQQAGTGAVRAGVELDAEHRLGVEAKADSAIGITGLEIKNETLTPFFTLGLAGAFAEVAVEVDVAGAQLGAAVFGETACLGQRSEQQAGGGQQGGRQAAPWDEYGVHQVYSDVVLVCV